MPNDAYWTSHSNRLLKLDDTTYLVASRSRKGEHHMVSMEGIPSCTCESSRFRGVCAHADAAEKVHLQRGKPRTASNSYAGRGKYAVQDQEGKWSVAEVSGPFGLRPFKSWHPLFNS